MTSDDKLALILDENEAKEVYAAIGTAVDFFHKYYDIEGNELSSDDREHLEHIMRTLSAIKEAMSKGEHYMSESLRGKYE